MIDSDHHRFDNYCVSQFSFLWQNIRENNWRRKDLFWLTVSVQVHLAPLFLGPWVGEAEHHGGEPVIGQSGLPHGRQTERTGQGTRQNLWSHAPSDLLPPTRLHLLIAHAVWTHQWIKSKCPHDPVTSQKPTSWGPSLQSRSLSRGHFISKLQRPPTWKLRNIGE
jgi:hypothetical protein